MAETRPCPNCNHETPVGAKFCASCGHSLVEAAPPAPTPQVQPTAQAPAKKSNTWIWVVGVIGLCLVCVLLIAGVYFLLPKVAPDIDLPNPFASKTPTPTNTMTPTPTFTPTPTLGVGSSMIRIKDGAMQMFIPAGSFMMGSNDGDSDEKPVHSVSLDAYWIDQTEVTNRMYRDCVNAGVCELPQKTESVTRDNYFNNPTYDNYPVVWVTWHDAVAYCRWVDAWLPTEAEWEFAARGDFGYKYPWGNESPTSSLANFNDNLGDLSEVGSYPLGASPFGVLDMAGNAYEWVYDVYDSDYYDDSPTYNPTGPTSGSRHTLRGASFNTSASTIRASNRGSYAADTTGDDDGFRCVSKSDLP